MAGWPIRTVSWLGFFALILWAWWVMFRMAGQMDVNVLGQPGEIGRAMAAMDPRMPMDMPMARFGPVFAMWGIMMAAMMLPTMVPTLTTYERLMHSANGTRAGWIGVLLGYFLVWLGFAALIAAVQIGLLFAGVVDMLGAAQSVWLQAGLLIVVGAYQFTRAKEVCHGICHAPMTYFLGHWRTGFAGGLRMGMGLGVFCALCCWGFMALGFVGGVMNLAWMGLATLFMVLEKLPQIGHRVLRPLGYLMIAGGIAVLATTL